MRKIKFRGMDAETGKWLIGDLIRAGAKPDGSSCVQIRYSVGTDDYGRSFYTHREVIPETVGQYTGLTDKNGAMVFEGDVIAPPDDKWDSGETERATICYNNELTRFLCRFWTIHGGEGYSGNIEGQQLCDYIKEKWEVIGNIHKNPELLEDK